MKDYVSFPVYDGNDINENIETLQKLLENTGIEIQYVKNEDPLFEKLNLGLLQFRWDADVLLMLSWNVMISLCHADTRLPG